MALNFFRCHFSKKGGGAKLWVALNLVKHGNLDEEILLISICLMPYNLFFNL